MALANSKVQYVSSVKWAAVPAYPVGIPAAGALCTNTANSPAVGNERVFACIIAGTGAGAVPTFTVTKGAITGPNSDGSSWQECTGQPGVNGDTTNSPVWPTATTVTLGQIIYVASNGSLQICNVASGNTSGSIPAFSATAGTVTNDGSNRWTSLGAASNFGNFAAPHARVLNADGATWQTVVPAIIYIDSAHAETGAASVTLANGQATTTAMNQYLSVSASGAIPPTSCTAGAAVNVTGAFNLSIGGTTNKSAYYFGITFNDGSGTSSAANLTYGCIYGSAVTVFDTCAFNQLSTNSASQNSPNGARKECVILRNCTITFGAAGQSLGSVNSSNSGTIIGGSIAATGTVPTNLVNVAATKAGEYLFRDVDISALNSGSFFLVGTSGVWTAGNIAFQNCKLGANVGMVNGTMVPPSRMSVHNCDSGSKNYRFFEQDYFGSITQETTIVRTGGATDGVTPISWNITPLATAKFGQPFVTEYFPIAQYNSLTAGSHTATIYLTSDAVLTNANFWLELENFATAGYPIGTLTTSRVADALTTGTGLTTDASTWASGKTYNYKITVTFSPAMAGYLKARLYACPGATAVYVDPKIYIDGASQSSKQYLLPGGGYICETGASGGMIQSRVFTGM